MPVFVFVGYDLIHWIRNKLRYLTEIRRRMLLQELMVDYHVDGDSIKACLYAMKPHLYVEQHDLFLYPKMNGGWVNRKGLDPSHHVDQDSAWCNQNPQSQNVCLLGSVILSGGYVRNLTVKGKGCLTVPPATILEGFHLLRENIHLNAQGLYWFHDIP